MKLLRKFDGPDDFTRYIKDSADEIRARVHEINDIAQSFNTQTPQKINVEITGNPMNGNFSCLIKTTADQKAMNTYEDAAYAESPEETEQMMRMFQLAELECKNLIADAVTEHNHAQDVVAAALQRAKEKDKQPEFDFGRI